MYRIVKSLQSILVLFLSTYYRCMFSIVYVSLFLLLVRKPLFLTVVSVLGRYVGNERSGAGR